MTPRPRTPLEAVEALRRDPRLAPGTGERFTGYSVMGLSFASGHVLGLRRWEASSLGRPYTSIWHRDPAGRWRVLADVPPAVSCARYISSLMRDALEMPVRVDWTAPDAFEVRVEGIALQWRVRLTPHPLLEVFGRMLGAVPRRLARSAAMRTLLERAGAAMIDAGRIRLDGSMPNGQRFEIAPQRFWLVAESSATLGGRPIGPPGPLPRTAMLGDFAVPDRGIFTIADATFHHR